MILNIRVIISCFNFEDTLSNQLDSLTKQTCSEIWGVLFVDDKITDNSRLVTEKYKEKILNSRTTDAFKKQWR